MLISRKITKDKRVVTDFRHLDIRIAENNLAYPLLKDTFSVLDNSRYEVLLLLDLNQYQHQYLLQSRKYCESIMDDLLLLTTTKKYCIAKLEDLLKVLHKNGVKMSLKK